MRILYAIFLVLFISCTKEPLIEIISLDVMGDVQGKTCLEDYIGYSLDTKRLVLPSYRSVDSTYRIVVDRQFILYYNNKYVSDYDGVIHFEEFKDTLNYAHDIVFQITHCDSFYFHGILFGKEKL